MRREDHGSLILDFSKPSMVWDGRRCALYDYQNEVPFVRMQLVALLVRDDKMLDDKRSTILHRPRESTMHRFY